MPKPSLSEGIRGINNGCGSPAAVSYPVTCPPGAVTSSDASLTPPPVPPKSEAVSIIYILKVVILKISVLADLATPVVTVVTPSAA